VDVAGGALLGLEGVSAERGARQDEEDSPLGTRC
jgi:hypothetical protein